MLSSYGYSGGYSSSSLDFEDLIDIILEASAGMLCVYLLALAASFTMLVWGAQMAQNKGKNAGTWVALILLFGLIAFIILACSRDESYRPSYRSSQYGDGGSMYGGNGGQSGFNRPTPTAQSRPVPPATPRPGVGTRTTTTTTRTNPDGSKTRVIRTVTRKPKSPAQSPAQPAEPVTEAPTTEVPMEKGQSQDTGDTNA